MACKLASDSKHIIHLSEVAIHFKALDSAVNIDAADDLHRVTGLS